MKKIIYIFALIAITLTSCKPDEFTPPPPCNWNDNNHIGFKTLSLKYPTKSDTVDISDEIAYFNIHGRPNETEYQDFMGSLSDNNYKSDQILNFRDVFKYNTAFKDRKTESYINIVFESLNCSYDTKSKTEKYEVDDKSVFEYHARGYEYTNSLSKQYSINVSNSDDSKNFKKTFATITVNFGPFYDKVNQKKGVIIWSKKIENTLYTADNSFEATGTFKITEVAPKKIYIGHKYRIEEF